MVLAPKICRECDLEKSIDSFPKGRRICKKCYALTKKHIRKKWRKNNSQKLLDYKKEWRKNNVEHAKEKDKEKYVKYSDRHKANVKQWRLSNPERKKLIYRRHRDLKRGAVGFHTLQEWEDLKKSYGHKCAKCRLTKPLTEDHIVPLSKGGTNYITNIQPLCLPCNSEKGVQEIKYAIL